MPPVDTPEPTSSPSPAPAGIRILALGDSYTIGEGVDPQYRWPVQLAGRLSEQGLIVAEPWIIARTGWTTGDLDAAITMRGPVGTFDLVTLLIGVNNQYQGRPIDTYREQFRSLLRRSIALAGDRPQRVIVLSIPDWGVTPFAQGSDREGIAVQIDAFNIANREESIAAGVPYVDVTPISRRAAQDPALIAGDGLHPSEQMYAFWVDLVLPVALEALGD